MSIVRSTPDNHHGRVEVDRKSSTDSKGRIRTKKTTTVTKKVKKSQPTKTKTTMERHETPLSVSSSVSSVSSSTSKPVHRSSPTPHAPHPTRTTEVHHSSRGYTESHAEHASAAHKTHHQEKSVHHTSARVAVQSHAHGSRSSSDAHAKLIARNSRSSSVGRHSDVVYHNTQNHGTVHRQEKNVYTTAHHDRSISVEHPEVIVNTIYADRSQSSFEDQPNRRRVVRRVERQAPRLIHHEEHILEGEGRVLKEYDFEEQVAVEYRAIREDVVEHIVAVPVTEEEVKRDKIDVRIVEIEKRVPHQTIIDVPETQIVEEIKEIPTPSGRVTKKLNYVTFDKFVPQERKVYIERPVEQIVEVPDITYIDVEEVIDTVEVPEYQDVVTVREVKVPTIVEVPTVVVEERDDITDVDLLIPVGVEAVSHVKFTVPTVIEKRCARGYPVYVPRFVEVPVNSIMLTKEQKKISKKLLTQMKELESSVTGKVVSACEIEKMGVAARDHHMCIQGHIQSTDLKTSLIDTFVMGRGASMSSSDAGVHSRKEIVAKGHHEGYYGHASVMAGWNDLKLDQYSHSVVSNQKHGHGQSVVSVTH